MKDVRFLYIFSKFNPEAMEVITENEFLTGMSAMRCNSISDLKKAIPQILQELKSEAGFEKMYTQVYEMTRKRINKDRIDIKNAAALQKFLFMSEFCPIKCPLMD
jgi:hypothetical protein